MAFTHMTTEGVVRQLIQILLLGLIGLGTTHCGSEKGAFFTLGRPLLLIAGQDTNHRGVSAYTLEGIPVGSIANFRVEASSPRGLAYFDDDTVLVAVDGSDGVSKLNLDGTKEIFHGSSNLNGNIYDMELGPDGYYYVIESNRIEVFNDLGERQASKLINTTTGSCTLSNPRSMTIDFNGYLVVTNQGGAGNILRYDISGDTATCVSSVAFGNSPYGVLAHSNGYLYITTQGDDTIYRADPDGSNAVEIWTVDLTILRDPTQILELPNGDLLVASSFTDTVERIQTDGTRVGSDPFIQDVYSLNVSDMIIIGVD